MVLLNRISCIRKQFLIFPCGNACSYKEKHFTFKHFQYICPNEDIQLRKRLKEKLTNALSPEALKQSLQLL